MRKQQRTSNHPRDAFIEWYHVTTLGQILQTLELSYLNSELNLSYCDRVLQLGALGMERVYIDEAFWRNVAVVDWPNGVAQSAPNVIVAAPDCLPIASDSIDVLILAHVLEFEANKHEVLREVERVVRPEGRVYVLGLNPWSVYALLRYVPGRSIFWQQRYVSCFAVLDWLSLLKFDADFSAAFSISSSRSFVRPSGFWSKTRAKLAFAYAVKGIKRRYTMIPIRPSWVMAPGLVAGQTFSSGDR